MKKLILLFVITIYASNNFAQQNANYSFDRNEFVISYNIAIEGKNNNGIAQTYNGGIKNVFVKNNKIRLRLVSLMRTQSIFYNGNVAANPIATVVKETGIEKLITNFSREQWGNYTVNDANNSFKMYDAKNLTILNYACKKGTVTTKSGNMVIVYYYPSVVNKTLAAAEPLFANVPGMVLKYSYTKGKNTITYTAQKIDTNSIDDIVFEIPKLGNKK